jgi:pimeloyl-ACP methyl ester carboxylesterase
MARFILVHGMWHGSWCWEKVTPLLAARGHDVVAVDLPRAPSPSLTGCRDAVLAQLKDGERAILVGHSLGGVVISEAAEAMPERIAKLVYLAGFLPKSGQSMFDLARKNRDSSLKNAMVVDDKGNSTLRPESVRNGLYGDCADDDVERAIARLVPEPLAAATTPASLGENFAKVPRAYVVCTEDRAVAPSLQRMMIEATACDDVVEIASSHSPFLSKPDELASILLRFI